MSAINTSGTEVRGMADLERLMRELDKLSRSSVAIAAPGVHETRETAHGQLRARKAAAGKKVPKAKAFRRKQADKKIPIAALIAWHEFGIGVPARPWVRSTFATRKTDLQRVIAQQIQRMIGTKGKHDTKASQAALGKFAIESMRRQLRSRVPPPLSDKTKANPDRDRKYIPLLDTGQIERSIEWRPG